MKRVHESVDYIKHRDCKQLHSLTEQLGSVGLRHDSLIDDIGQVKVREYRIVKDENGNKFTVYVVRVFSENAVWDVSRRYSDFFRLNDVLVGNGCSVPVLPPKQMFGVFSKDFLQKRRGSLEHYLQGVLHLLSQDSLRSFLWKSHILVSDLTTKKQEERKYQQHHHQQQQLDDDLLLTDFEHESLPQLSTSVDSAFEATQAFEQHEQNMNSDNNDDDSDGVGSINSGKSTDENDEKSGNNDGNNKNNKNKNESKPCLDDFEMVRVLGKGSFGKVMLCRKKGSGKLYAIKILKKQHVVKRKQVAHTKTERSVLGLVDHPFVVKLHYAFQTGDKLHFVLDFCSGGELFFHLGKAGKFTENLGKFYAAEIALALGHLHTKGVVYRDLKPENILLDHEGHIKLADFGLSKEGIVSGIKGTHSFCGTPEYLAPEVLNRTGHGTSVDWWSLGALLYEMLTGLPPWYSQDRQKMFASIRSSELRFPDCISIVARKILNAFLERDVRKRLGSVHDVEEVKAHEFFQSVQWEQLYNREIPSPFVPRLNSSTDTQNFDTQFTRMPINSIDASHFNMSPRMSSSMLSEGHPMFDGFTFVEPSNMDKQHQLATQQFNHHLARPNNTHALPPPTKFGTPSSPTSLSSTLLFE